jgi:hypothetical protein
LSQIEQIRASLSIAQAWRMLGLDGQPGKNCRSPFRPDKRPSFSIYSKAGWERWFDQGEGVGGDVIDFWARAKGLSVKEAIADILELYLAPNSLVASGNRPPEAFLPKTGIRWPPDIKEPSEAECRALGELRSLSPEAFFTAGRLGTLKVATVYSAPAWIITDPSGICAEARRFDGARYGDKKSFALPGSKKSWPVGIETSRPELGALGNILLVEGGPDYFAALELATQSEINFRPAAMLGANCSIGPEAERHFHGATVLIIPHNDPAGIRAGERWAEQSSALGAKKIFVQSLPIEHDDLNEFLSSCPRNATQLLQGFQSDDRTRPHPPSQGI